MPKVYEPKRAGGELFLRLRPQSDGDVTLEAVSDTGEFVRYLAEVRCDGIHIAAGVNPAIATRAGFSPEALDSNGRLKVIGQESVEAERLLHAKFQYDTADDDALIVDGGSYGALDFAVMIGRRGFVMNLSPDNIRDLAARLNRHVAFLDKEGL